MTTIDDVAYRTINGITLLARLYWPDANGPVKWMIDVHGGAWGSGNRLNNAVIHKALAAHGIGVFALDFRLSGEARYPAMVNDVNYAIRWFKAHAETLNVEMSMLGAFGSSSGAQQAGLVALCPARKRWTAFDPAVNAFDASVSFFVAAWPILDPLARYRMVQDAGNERLVAAHNACFASEADMEEGNPYLLLRRGEATHTPPMCIIQGTADANVEHTWQDKFADLYREKGGSVETHKFDGEPHTFVTANPTTDASQAAIAMIQEFVLKI